MMVFVLGLVRSVLNMINIVIWLLRIIISMVKIVEIYCLKTKTKQISK